MRKPRFPHIKKLKITVYVTQQKIQNHAILKQNYAIKLPSKWPIVMVFKLRGIYILKISDKKVVNVLIIACHT